MAKIENLDFIKELVKNPLKVRWTTVLYKETRNVYKMYIFVSTL